MLAHFSGCLRPPSYLVRPGHDQRQGEETIRRGSSGQPAKSKTVSRRLEQPRPEPGDRTPHLILLTHSGGGSGRLSRLCDSTTLVSRPPIAIVFCAGAKIFGLCDPPDPTASVAPAQVTVENVTDVASPVAFGKHSWPGGHVRVFASLLHQRSRGARRPSRFGDPLSHHQLGRGALLREQIRSLGSTSRRSRLVLSLCRWRNDPHDELARSRAQIVLHSLPELLHRLSVRPSGAQTLDVMLSVK